LTDDSYKRIHATPYRNLSEPALALAKLWKLPTLPPLDLREREWVYFLQSQVEPRLIKIGRTRHLKWRVLGIQTQSPVALKLVAAVSAPAGTEQILHQVLHEHRCHGEWFLPESQVLALIAVLPKGSAISHDLVKSLAPGIDCDAIFLRMTLRKGEGGQLDRVPLSSVTDARDQILKDRARAARKKLRK